MVYQEVSATDWIYDKEGESIEGILINSSGYQGYHIEFLGNGTFRYRTVATKTSQCNGNDTGGISSYDGDWEIVSIPNNGLIFVKDSIWVDGIVNQDRVTVVAAAEPFDTGNVDIFLNNDLLYTNKDGQDVIGLIAQRNVIIGLYAEDDLEIDAALIAKNGRRYRPDYGSVFECGSTALARQFYFIRINNHESNSLYEQWFKWL